MYVHRAVAAAFIENPDAKPCVNHKNGDKQCNSAENLEWATRAEDRYHAYHTGLIKAPHEYRQERM